ncbi:HAD-IA family hydrolase [Luteolibacter marinus]|uniref:HAD-IA family hydrolase n=1 Tax=Luteolibacter marinus TaxID=2776705 RepID=UPI0018689294
MIRALFFDAAGTLIEPAEPVAAVYSRCFSEHGWEVGIEPVRDAFGKVFSAMEVPDYHGDPDGDRAEVRWWRQVVERTLRACEMDPATDPERFDGCFAALFSHYAMPASWRVFPEVVPVLEQARGEGLRIGVVSNFDRRLHAILDGWGLSFDFVLTSSEARARKPDAAIFRQALGRVALDAGEVMHAGDSRSADHQGALGVGIIPYLLDRPRNDLHGFMDEVISRRRK